MVSTIRTSIRSVSNIPYFVLLSIMLVGCATNATMDQEERETLASAPAVSMVLYPHDPFIVTTALSQGLTGVFGVPLTAGEDAQRGRDLIAMHRLPDPSTLVIDYISDGLKAAYALTNLDDTPSLQFNNDPTALRSAVGGGLAFDFRTFYWRGSTQLTKKAMYANIVARLLDLNTGVVLWEQACSGSTTGSGDTWENTLEINSVTSDVAQECTQQLLKSFVEPEHLPFALSAVEAAAVNWKQEMGETAAEITQNRLDRLMDDSLLGNWAGTTQVNSNFQQDMRLRINAQESEYFTGKVSIVGSAVSCNNVDIKLLPGTAENYELVGCAGSGSLKREGNKLKGKFLGYRVNLSRSP